MIITQEEDVDRQTVLHIELEDEDLDPYLDQGYKRVAQRTAIPGFRKGKAPRSIVQNYLGRESLLNEVLDSMLSEVTERAISEQQLDASGLPGVELVSVTPFTFKATVPLAPEVDLGPYQHIRIAEKPVPATNEGDIEGRLDQLRHEMASWEPVDREVKMGDMVTMDVSGRIGRRSVLDEKEAEFFLDEDGVRPFPGFSQQLEGVVRDEVREFDVVMPDDHSDPAVAGKEAHFAVEISEIKERVLAELDDEFAKSLGDEYESVDDLRRQVREDLKSEAQANADRGYRESVVKALVDGATVELPPLLVEHEIEHMERDRMRLFSRLEVRMDDYLRSVGKTEEEMRNDVREEAVARLERTFVFSKLVEGDGLEVPDEEVDEKIESLRSESSEGSEDGEDSEDVRNSVRRMLLLDKSMDSLVAVAKRQAPGADKVESEPPEGKGDDNLDKPEAGGDTDDTKA